MKRNALLLAGAVSAAALATSIAVANVALAQEAPVTESVAEPKTQEEAAKTSEGDSTPTVRQTVVKPKAVDDAKAEPEKAAVADEKPEAVTAANDVVAEPKAAAKAETVEETAAADADEAVAVKTEAEPEKVVETEDKAEPKQQEQVATTSADDSTLSVRQIVIEPKAVKDAKVEPTPVAEPENKASLTEEAVAVKTEAEPEKVAEPENKAAAVEEGKADPVAAKAETAVADPAETTTDVISKENAAVPVKRSSAEIVLVLQTELKRVGCYDGAIDGIWGGYSQEALEAFRDFGQIEHADAEPSEAWIAHVKGVTKTVCHAHRYGDAYPSQHQGYNHGYQRPSHNGYRGSYPGGSTYRY